MPSPRKAVSIVVPTLNEAENLPILFKRIDESLKTHQIAYEIIIVDDHSSDKTAAVAATYADRYNVRVVLKQGQRGKAFSLLEGFKLAAYDTVCMIDADLQYPPEAIAAMYDQMIKLNVDIVITERVELQTSALRRLASKVFHLIFARLLFGIEYDTQSGLKLFKARVMEHMTLTPSPWSFDLEFIIRSLEQGYTINSHPINFDKRHFGEAKISVVGAAFELARASLKLHKDSSTKEVRRRYKKNLDYLRMPSMFVISSLLFISLGMAVLPAHQAAALAPVSESSVRSELSLNADILTVLTNDLGLTKPTTVLPGTAAPVTTTSATTTPATAPMTTTASSVSTPTATTVPTTATEANAPVYVPASVPNTTMTNQANPQPYYFSSENPSPAITPLARAAVLSLFIGGVFVILGLLSVSGTIKPMRSHLYRMWR